MKFNEKIFKLRKLKGLTQDEFASAVGVSRQAVYKWESGQSYPEVPKLLEMKLLFDISLDDLLDDNYEVIVPEDKKRKRSPKPKAEIKETAYDKEEFIKKEEDEKTEEPVLEEIKVSSPAPEPVYSEPAVFEERVTEKEEKQPEEPKRRGFFARLFGRK